MKIVAVDLGSSPVFGLTTYDGAPDVGYLVHVPAVGTTGGQVLPSLNARLLIALVNRVDSSNYSVSLPSDQSPPHNVNPGDLVEVYAENGSITIFPPGGETFLDGSTSVSTSIGALFRRVINNLGYNRWARLL